MIFKETSVVQISNIHSLVPITYSMSEKDQIEYEERLRKSLKWMEIEYDLEEMYKPIWE